MEIKSLKLYTSRLKKQRNFYSKVLGLQELSSTSLSVSYKIGNSVLAFIQKPNSTPYHFAINIPANKEHEALDWLKARVEILKDGENEIQDFDFWNAKAIYFYDADRNIVEFIARRNLKNSRETSFDQNSLLEISEIGVPLLDIETCFEKLNEKTGIEVYDGNFERFCAIGDEHGLFIVINKAVKDWFPINDKAFSSEFEMDMVQHNKGFRIEFVNEEIKVQSKD